MSADTTTRTITDEHEAYWREHGFVVIDRFLDPDTVERARAALHRQLPTEADVRRDSTLQARLTKGLAFESFPFESHVLNQIGVHPELVGFARRVFGGRQPFLTQSLLRTSYAGYGDVDQELHRDFTDNTLLYPSDDPAFNQLPAVIYYTDVTVDTAPFHVCSRTIGDSRPPMPRFRSRDDDPELYEHETAIVAPAGSLVIYTMSTFHRGSAFTGDTGFRAAHHIGLRPSGNEWQGWDGGPRVFEQEKGIRCMAGFSPEERRLIGVPEPGHPYWTSETIDGVAARYPGIDMTPYRDAARAKGRR